ncbi:hypothetical protein V5799_027230 [Amblyomma americanum]|uniref:Uncharacterized protein n=1 Tax=Amblyomma americanum TaxID=6943 RepID=A0AAQ4DGB3_AMBAM
MNSLQTTPLSQVLKDGDLAGSAGAWKRCFHFLRRTVMQIATYKQYGTNKCQTPIHPRLTQENDAQYDAIIRSPSYQE